MPEVASPATSFLGRERELAEGEQRLRESRLLTITGPGGAGKTRFALELARRVEGGFSGGSTTCLFASSAAERSATRSGRPSSRPAPR